MKYLPWILLALVIIIIIFRKQIREFFNAPVGPVDGATCVTADNSPGKYQAGICIPTGLPDNSTLQRDYDYGYVQQSVVNLTCNSSITYRGVVYKLSSTSIDSDGHYIAVFSNGSNTISAHISQSQYNYLKDTCFSAEGP